MSGTNQAFAAWLTEMVERLKPTLTRSELAKAADYSRSMLTKVLHGDTAASPEFQVRVMLALWQHNAFHHPGEVFAGWARLGMTPKDCLALITATPVKGERAYQQHQQLTPAAPGKLRSSFLQWLKQWHDQRIDPRLQGATLPIWYTPRQQDLARLREMLASVYPMRMAVWGMGGIGKTVLAQAVALDPALETVFSGGVLWATLGPEGSALPILKQWGQHLKIAPRHTEPAAWIDAIHTHLTMTGRTYLCIIDDVWDAVQAQPLLDAAQGASVLLTVRERHIAQQLASDDCIWEVRGLPPTEGLALIKNRCHTAWQPDWITAAQELFELTEGLPLALVLGAALAKNDGWQRLLTALRDTKSRLDTLALTRAERREHSLRVTLDLSYQRLPPTTQLWFRRLGALAPGVAVTFFCIEHSWAVLESAAVTPEGLKARIQRALAELVDASLLQEQETGRLYRLHTLVALYAAAALEATAEAPEVHRGLLNSQLLTLYLCLKPELPLKPSLQENYAFATENWLHFLHVWQQVERGLWKTVAPATPVSPQTQLLDWLKAAYNLGGEYLRLQNAWEGLIKWCQHLQYLCNQCEPGANQRRLMGMLLVQEIYAHLHLGQTDAVGKPLEHLRQIQFDVARREWEIQIKTCEGQWQLQRQQKRKARACRNWIEANTDKLLAQHEDRDLAWLVLLEIKEFFGNHEAQSGSPYQAERYWNEACSLQLQLVDQGTSICLARSLDLLKRIAQWRARHGMWEIALNTGKLWALLESITSGGLLLSAWVSILEWGLRSKDARSCAWAAAILREGFARAAVVENHTTAYLWLATWNAQQQDWEEAQHWVALAQPRSPEHSNQADLQPWLESVAQAISTRQLPALPPVNCLRAYRTGHDDWLYPDELLTERVETLLGFNVKHIFAQMPNPEELPFPEW